MGNAPSILRREGYHHNGRLNRCGRYWEERVGIATHYDHHLAVAGVGIESGMLREGDNMHTKCAHQ
jgi:hypothetical protein